MVFAAFGGVLFGLAYILLTFGMECVVKVSALQREVVEQAASQDVQQLQQLQRARRQIA